MAEKTTSPIRSDNPFQKALSMAIQSDAPSTRRRAFLTAAAAAALGPTVAALFGGPLASVASAANADNLPDFAPVPAEAFGPALNADGYFVGQIDGNLYWVTDSVYQANVSDHQRRRRPGRCATHHRSQPAARDRIGDACQRHAQQGHAPGLLSLARGPHWSVLAVRYGCGAHRTSRESPSAAPRQRSEPSTTERDVR